MTQDERIDKMLAPFIDKQMHHFWHTCALVFPNESPDDFGAIHEALLADMRYTHNLIDSAPNDDMFFRLTGHGIDIVDAGGWIANKLAEQNEHNEFVILKTKEAEFQTRHIKINTRIQVGMLVLAILGAVGAIYGIDQASRNTRLEQKLETVTTEKNRLSQEKDDLNNLLETKDKEIEKLTQRIDSLSRPPIPNKKP